MIFTVQSLTKFGGSGGPWGFLMPKRTPHQKLRTGVVIKLQVVIKTRGCVLGGGGVNVTKYKFICVVDMTGSSSFGLDILAHLSFKRGVPDSIPGRGR